jgi:hypothetical protein
MAVETFGKTLVAIGLAVAATGSLLWLWGGKGRHGLLPGDIYLERGNFKLVFPIVTCIVVSIVLTLLLRLMRR